MWMIDENSLTLKNPYFFMQHLAQTSRDRWNTVISTLQVAYVDIKQQSSLRMLHILVLECYILCTKQSNKIRGFVIIIEEYAEKIEVQKDTGTGT